MSTPDYYVWGHQNDRLESQRLTHQHFLCKNLFDTLLQPSVTSDLESRTLAGPIRIADVACGNGIWAHEVANSEFAEKHNLEVTAFDLTDELFPPKDERCENVSYTMWDMYGAPAEKYQGVFDIVNVRLIFGAVKSNNPRPVLENLLKLLKPNGWLQWCEFDFDNPVAPEGSAYNMVGEMFKIARGGHGNGWVPQLGQIFQEAGMNEIEFASRMPKNEMMRYWKDNWYIGLGNLVRVVKNEHVDQLWDACEVERSEKGMRGAWRTVMAVGKKS